MTATVSEGCVPGMQLPVTVPAATAGGSSSGAAQSPPAKASGSGSGAAPPSAPRSGSRKVLYDLIAAAGDGGLGRDEAVAKMTAAMRADGQWGEERDDKWCRATVTTLLGRKDDNIPWEETEEKGVYTLKAGAAAGRRRRCFLRLVRR